MAKIRVIATLVASMLFCLVLLVGCSDSDTEGGVVRTADATSPTLTINPLDPSGTTWEYSEGKWEASDNTPTFDGKAVSNTVAGNHITSVEYRIDGGGWMSAQAVGNDGFTENTEHYHFSIATTLSTGAHRLEAQATDAEGMRTEESEYATIDFVVVAP